MTHEFQNFTAHFMCRVCAVVVGRRAQLLEDHVRSTSHVFNYVVRYLPTCFHRLLIVFVEYPHVFEEFIVVFSMFFFVVVMMITLFPRRTSTTLKRFSNWSDWTTMTVARNEEK